MKKNFWIEIGKTFIAAAVAFIILSLFCLFYYNTPLHIICEDGATDYTWKPNVRYWYGLEGFGYGKINNEGYMNLFDYDNNTTVNVLVMGSSNMEALQIPMRESTANLLSDMLEKTTVYNIGISGHTFLTCAGNLLDAIKKYQPTDYVIIESSNVEFSDEELKKFINGSFEELSLHDRGVLNILRENPYIRLLYKQAVALIENRKSVDEGLTLEKNTKNNKFLLNEVLCKMSYTASRYGGGVRIAIIYHPQISINKNGSLLCLVNNDAVSVFADLCAENDIIFLDMSKRFEKEYKEHYAVPYGFSNTSVGEGHLNKSGHAMMANEIYRLIKEGK